MFIEKGKIIEDGTHDELIKLQGSYYNTMKSNNIDNDNVLQHSLDVDNENLPSSKLVEKQMFAESQQIQNNQGAVLQMLLICLFNLLHDNS